ncbi:MULTISPECIES: thiol-activated cytolysin family protein [unclassified Cellulophaga]|uniref:thiol-activated cytolysin family protein n=1 Tax=unclassified Cellulophaga TaxID=2634405 RepID=UPI0026E277CB|nr:MULTISPECIES: thiol-activated cytolysin family protein [unclassified Cellulophaga]MDO6493061.1 thiol-activated cytolysin family protein [Cellulophaga sp. 2_MG-2023]MDO6496314.1 thiol-activated cytolysin family protein [Cellulophaga sp. 3_MG-2023]
MKSYYYIIVAILFLVSCDKNDDSSSPNLNELKSVSFQVEPDNIISSEKTGNTRFDASANTTNYEYLTLVEKQTTLEPLSIVSANSSDIIYPGSILRGSSFMDATYDPIVLKNDFNDVQLSLTLRGKNLPVSASTPPTLSKIRTSLNGLLENSQALIDYNAIPSFYSYESNSVTTQESFNKTLDIHIKADVLGNLVSSSFNFDQSSGTVSSKKYVVVEVRQWFYNVSIDPKNYTQWIDGEIKAEDLGSHEPLYVSSVDYGRVAYLLIETEKDEAYNSLMVKASVKVALSIVDASTDVTYSEEFKSLFENNKIKVLIAGGPAQLGGRVNDYDSFVRFLETPSTADLVSSAAPISYKVRRLLDNTEVEVKQMYTEQILEYKKD